MSAIATQFNRSIDIKASPARVWEVLSDFERWAEWTPSVRSIRRLDAGALAVGCRLKICQPKLPPALWTVVDLVPGQGFTYTNRGLGVLVTAGHWIAPTEGGCRVTLNLRFSGLLSGLVVRLAKTITNRYLDLEAAGLKQRCEGG